MIDIKLIEKYLYILFKSNSGKWDKQIALSPKDISEMLNLPLSSTTKIYERIQDQGFKDRTSSILPLEY